MHKRILAIALCLVMVSAFAVTSAVSAAGKHATQPTVAKYDVYMSYGKPYTEQVMGSIVVNLATGQYTYTSTVKVLPGSLWEVQMMDCYYGWWNNDLTLYPGYKQATKAGTVQITGLMTPAELKQLNWLSQGTYGVDWAFVAVQQTKELPPK